MQTELYALQITVAHAVGSFIIHQHVLIISFVVDIWEFIAVIKEIMKNNEKNNAEYKIGKFVNG